MSPKPVAVVTVSPSVVEKDLQSPSVNVRERRSLSPLSIQRAQEFPREEDRISTSQHLLPSTNSILKRQAAIGNESTVSLPSSPQAMHIMYEHDENAFHGSSEFMLVLYPEDEGSGKDTIDTTNDAKIRIGRDISKREEKVAKDKSYFFLTARDFLSVY